MTKKDMKTFWENNKKKIFIGGTAVAGLCLTTCYVIYKKHITDSVSVGYDGGITFWRTKPSRLIPETEGFKILDIADDKNDGCVTWLSGCKLSDCGRLGEGLTKIERVDPDMLVTMAILGKETVEKI